MSSYLALAQAWLEEEPNEANREALRRAVRDGDEGFLEAAFAEPLTFGTAGLRGPVGVGPARMNEVVIGRVSYGLGRFILEQGLERRPVVVGFDGRKASAGFARECAEILAALGVLVVLVDSPAATPVLVHLGRVRNAASTVAVTPSHNPRGDAGFKVYDDQGVQIIAPWDERIAVHMASCPNVAKLPRSSSGIEVLTHEAIELYRSQIERIVASVGLGTNASRVAYTPLHGVGLEGLRLAAGATNTELAVVLEQGEVDGDFPTVPFPNPEEKGALGLLLSLMKTEGIDVGLASDPDADRLAICLARDGATSAKMLSGDQVGLLLASLALRTTKFSSPLLVNSVVSSPGLRALAQKFGARHEHTLTGFKWLCRPALADPEFLFAYEEALGYCFVPDGRKDICDKDGIGASALLLAFASKRPKPERVGSWIERELEEIAWAIGLWTTVAKSLRVEGANAMAILSLQMKRLRENLPSNLGKLRVESSRDYLHGAESRPSYLGTQDLLVLELESDVSLCIRPSGTEPKLKVYCHLRANFARGDDFEAVESKLREEGLSVVAAFEAYLSLVVA